MTPPLKNAHVRGWGWPPRVPSLDPLLLFEGEKAETLEEDPWCNERYNNKLNPFMTWVSGKPE